MNSNSHAMMLLQSFQVTKSLSFLQNSKRNFLIRYLQIMLSILGENQEQPTWQSPFMQLTGGVQEARTKPQRIGNADLPNKTVSDPLKGANALSISGKLGTQDNIAVWLNLAQIG